MAQSYGIEGYLFSGAVILFIFLLILEKKYPYMPIPKEALKASFKTNTGAFLLNNVMPHAPDPHAYASAARHLVETLWEFLEARNTPH